MHTSSKFKLDCSDQYLKALEIAILKNKFFGLKKKNFSINFLK